MCDVNPAARLCARCKKKKKKQPFPPKDDIQQPQDEGSGPFCISIPRSGRTPFIQCMLLRIFIHV